MDTKKYPTLEELVRAGCQRLHGVNLAMDESDIATSFVSWHCVFVQTHRRSSKLGIFQRLILTWKIRQTVTRVYREVFGTPPSV